MSNAKRERHVGIPGVGIIDRKGRVLEAYVEACQRCHENVPVIDADCDGPWVCRNCLVAMALEVSQVEIVHRF